jgi:hypothetical protein
MNGFHLGVGTVVLIIVVYVIARLFPQPAHMLGLP